MIAYRRIRFKHYFVEGHMLVRTMLMAMVMTGAAIAQSQDQTGSASASAVLQNDSLSKIAGLQGQIKELSARLETSEKGGAQSQERLNRQIADLADNYARLVNATNIGDSTRYTVMRGNVLASVAAYAELRGSMQAARLQIASERKNAFISELANPQSEKLGFKLSTKISEIMEKEVFSRETGGILGIGAKRLTQTRQNILGTVAKITESPVTQALMSFNSPIVGIANSILGLLRSISISDPNEVKAEDIQRFETELVKLVTFYNTFHEATSVHDASMQRHEAVLTDLQEELAFQYNTNLGEMAIARPKRDTMKTGDWLVLLKEAYSRDTIEARFRTIEVRNQRGNIQYVTTLASAGVFKSVNNSFDDLIALKDQYMGLANELIVAENLYYNQIKVALENGVNAGIILPGVGNDLRRALQEKHETALRELRTSLQLEVVKSRMTDVHYKIRIY